MSKPRLNNLNPLQKLWNTQKKPILFFGFIILAVGLGFYSSYSNQQLAKKWSNQVTSQVSYIEQTATSLTKEKKLITKQTQVTSLLNQIISNAKSAQSQDEQVNLKSYNLKLYYNNYLDIHKKTLTKIQTNLVTAQELERLDGWEIRLRDHLVNYPLSYHKITEEYKLGIQLNTAVETYIKTSEDTVLIGKLVTLQDYYKPIINWYQKTGLLEQGEKVPSQDILAKKTELENLIAVPKLVSSLFIEVVPSSIFTPELVSAKNSLVKIIKKINE